MSSAHRTYSENARSAYVKASLLERFRQCSHMSFRQTKVLLKLGIDVINSFFFLPGGHPAGLDGFVGCIDLTYLRDSLTNIRIRVLSPGRPSLGRMPHSPYYFFRGRSTYLPVLPSLHLCMHVCGECWRVCN